MVWPVVLHDEFAPEFAALPPPVVQALTAAIAALEVDGPELGRPTADTLHGSAHANMKELRVAKSWRFAFAFDPSRQAVILVGGSKAGTNEKRFYRTLIRTADERFNDWIGA